MDFQVFQRFFVKMVKVSFIFRLLVPQPGFNPLEQVHFILFPFLVLKKVNIFLSNFLFLCLFHPSLSLQFFFITFQLHLFLKLYSLLFFLSFFQNFVLKLLSVTQVIVKSDESQSHYQTTHSSQKKAQSKNKYFTQILNVI
jgi:hypothetical protein